MIPYRDDNPAHRTPWVTGTLIGLCVLGQLWQWSLGREEERLVLQLGLIPAVLTGHAILDPAIALVPPWMTLVTSMFLHGGLAHLGGNMLYLWIFGNNIEDRLGHARFLLFYLLCGLAAAAAQVAPQPASEIPMIGASGAISGVLGAYLLLYPHARIHVFIPVSLMFLHTIPAVWVLGFWFVMQVLGALLADTSTGGVAWWAHVGGFVAGLALVPVFLLGTGPPPRRRRAGPWG